MVNLSDIGVMLDLVLQDQVYPRNIKHMPAVKFLASLDLDQIILFLDELIKKGRS